MTQEGLNQRADMTFYQGLDRQLKVKKSGPELWLKILFIDKSLQIVKENKKFFSGFYRDLTEIEICTFDKKIAALTQKSLK